MNRASTTKRRPGSLIHPRTYVRGSSKVLLEAFKTLLSHTPVDTGMAFVLIQHLDPKHESMTPEILARSTGMPVKEIKDGMRVQPNNVYVIPPNCNLGFAHGLLKILPRTESRGLHMPLDFFFRELAEAQKTRAIGVVLSGTASDGTQGLRSIKAEGGITLVQDPESAKYDGMPRSAIASGVVDLISTPEGIAAELARIARHPYVIPQGAEIEPEPKKKDESLSKIFFLLRSITNVDFSHYKSNTIQRRIARRMLLQKTDELAKYANFLENNPDEIKALFADILIHVTGFFRDKKVFDDLKTRILPKYMKNRDRSLPFRVWVPGCSTGEEAYSIAMTFLELQDESKEHTKIRTPLSIFATDISEQALQKARTAIYPESISEEVSKERLKKFFDKVDGGGYRIAKWLRDSCLFSRHDVTRDPPFAKVDLISCRNVLIYFDSELQKIVLPIFHYALNPNGILLLGKSESVGGFSDLFSLTDTTNKIYSKTHITTPLKIQFPLSRYSVERLTPGQKASESTPRGIDVKRELERITVAEYAPPAVVINDVFEIVQSQGDTAPFLRLSPGHPSFNLLRMAHPELIADLRAAIQAARKTDGRLVKEGLCFRDGGKLRTLTIKVVPIPSPSKEPYFTVFFEEAKDQDGRKTETRSKTRKARAETTKESKRNQYLRAVTDRHHLEVQKKLSANQEYQQSLIEEYETAQEELVSSNEELQSTNEELQSTNEEMETSKEELQSANEELTTVNDEMQTRNSEMISLSSDLINLLSSVDIPIVMVGSDGKIRRFTPKAGKALKLIPTDVGRPIGDIKPNIQVPDLDLLVSDVMEHMTMKEVETQDGQGHWYNLQVRPYRTADNKIDGAVIALLDIDALKRNAETIKKTADDLKMARDDAASIIQSQPIPLLVIGSHYRVKLANDIFYKKFKVSPSETVGRLISELGSSQWNIQKLQKLVETTLNQGVNFDSFEVEHDFPQIGRKIMLVSSTKTHLIGTNEAAVLLAIEDVTDQRNSENQRAQLLVNEQKANQAKDEFLATLSHELRTPLTAILSWSQLLRTGKLDAEKIRRGNEIVEQSARAQAQLIDDLLDISRIQAGKLNLIIQKIDPSKIISSAIDSTRSLAANKSIQIETEIDPSVKTIFADPNRLQQILWNLATNSIKFSSQGGRIWIKLDRITSPVGERIQFQVRDNGKGIKQEFMPALFERFTQVDSTTTRAYGGLGLGLAIVRKLVEMHGGTVEVESAGEGKGATFTVCLPVEPTAKFNTAEAEAEAEAGVTLRGLRILVVDDDANAREVFSVMLQTFGAEVKIAESARQALALFEEYKPDVLVSDIAMPIEDGYSLIGKIRALKSKLAKTPALALTAYAGREDIQRAHLAGFQSHVSKPVDANKLALAIARVAARK
ncbi:CheR family methyltransferase [Bdellovibrionota bacterium FG-1]